MKKLFLLLFIPIFGYAQNDHNFEYNNLEIPKENGKITYKQTIDVSDKGADQLFTTARIWFLDSFKSSKDVIQYEERETGIISGNGNTSLLMMVLGIPVEQRLFFSVRIEVKDEKFRYQITDLFVQSDPNLQYTKIPVESWFTIENMYRGNGKPKKLNFNWYDIYINEIYALEDSIIEKMKSSSGQSNSDWE